MDFVSQVVNQDYCWYCQLECRDNSDKSFFFFSNSTLDPLPGMSHGIDTDGLLQFLRGGTPPLSALNCHSYWSSWLGCSLTGLVTSRVCHWKVFRTLSWTETSGPECWNGHSASLQSNCGVCMFQELARLAPCGWPLCSWKPGGAGGQIRKHVAPMRRTPQNIVESDMTHKLKKVHMSIYQRSL